MKRVDIHAAKVQFFALVEEAAAGREIIIAKAGKPLARLMPIGKKRFDRQPGRLKGLIHMHDNFDDPLPPDIGVAFGIVRKDIPIER